MLLASLECKYISTLAIDIFRCADNTTRKLADMILGTSKESDIWTAVTQRNSQCLRVSADNISSPLSRSLDNGKG